MKDIKIFKQELLDIIANPPEIIEPSSGLLVNRFYNLLEDIAIKGIPNWEPGKMYWIWDSNTCEYRLVLYNYTTKNTFGTWVNLETLVRSTESTLQDYRGGEIKYVSILTLNTKEMTFNNHEAAIMRGLLRELAVSLKNKPIILNDVDIKYYERN